MSAEFSSIFRNFIDIVYKIFIFFAVYFVIQDSETEVVKVDADLVKAPGFWGGLHQADFAVFGVVTGPEGFEFGDRRVGPRHHGLANVDSAGLVFAEPVQGSVDNAGFGGSAVDNGEISFMDFPALLHFAQKGGVFFSPCHEEESGGFPVESANQGHLLS